MVKDIMKTLEEIDPMVENGYSQRIFSFDLEDTNGYIIDGIASEFDYTKDPSYYTDIEKTSLVYMWQFGIDGDFDYDRKLEDLKPVLDFLANQEYKSICWIHNLPHEWHFLRNIIDYDDVFARKPHKPMKATYGNLEFRCTYQLTHQSLEALGKSLGYPKGKDFNYDEIKTPETKLERDEIKYGLRDIEIIYEKIRRMKEEYGTLQDIPMTQTGIPRKVIKDMYQNDKKFHKKMAELLPKNAAEYARLRKAFVGGWVHSNYFYIGINLKDCVYAYDITSSYPTQMVLQKFPMSRWVEARPGTYDRFLDDDEYLCYMELEMSNVKSAGFNDYLSQSKVYDAEDLHVENGRIYKAKKFTVTCTEIDYKIMQEAYNADFKILRLWYATAGYLDKKYVEEILSLYYDKVTLTGDPEKKELRDRSKEKLNSTFGMEVSAVVYDDCNWTGETWDIPIMTTREMTDHIDIELTNLRAKPYKIITSYSHGVFVTAFARAALWAIIKKVNKKVVYHDTDSVYAIGDQSDIINEYNENIKKKLLAVCKERGIDPERVHPKTPDGEECWLGVYTCDNDELDGKPFAEFKTLGSKRYAYRKEAGKPIKITVAGVNKAAGVKELKDDMDNFVDGMTFGYDTCKKLIPCYNDAQPHSTWIDRDGNVYQSDYKYGITLQPTQYSLSLGQEFIDTLSAMGSLSSLFSELTIDELTEIDRAEEGA